MFRKLLLLATAVLACTACQTEDEPFSYDQVGYTGTLTVRALAGDTHYEFSARGDAIIPYYRDGEDLLPMDASRRIDDFEAELDTQEGSLAVTFVCMGFRVGYAGTQIK